MRGEDHMARNCTKYINGYAVIFMYLCIWRKYTLCIYTCIYIIQQKIFINVLDKKYRAEIKCSNKKRTSVRHSREWKCAYVYSNIYIYHFMYHLYHLYIFSLECICKVKIEIYGASWQCIVIDCMESIHIYTF